MFKKFTPTYHAKSIYEVDIDFFKKNNIKILFLDLDNTLDSYKTILPSENALSLKKKLEDNGIRIIILSNNTSKRVSVYANALGVSYVNSIGKPFARKINKFIKEQNFDKDLIMMVGDQLITDVQAANRAKLKSIYVDKLVKEDQITTRFNRLFERPIKRHLIKKNKLKDWRNLANE